MGNKITFHPRVLLTQEIALRFRFSDLDRDVLPMIQRWRAQGAGLTISLEEFQSIFGKMEEPESQFGLFDIDRDGKIDAHEVIMAAILLSTADVQRKLEAAFGIYDSSCACGTGRNWTGGGTLNFEEAIIVLQACARGLLKVAQFDFEITEAELCFYCKSLFHMHRLDADALLNLRQFKEWAMADPCPHSFLYLFHFSRSLPDIYEQAAKASQEQELAFLGAAEGHHRAPAEALKQSGFFRNAIRAISDEEVEFIVDLMSEGDPSATKKAGGGVGAVKRKRFEAVLRPWNIFNELDLDGNGTLDEKDIEALLWALSGQRPPTDDVNALSKLAGAYVDGGIDRSTWAEAVISQQDGRPPNFNRKHIYAGVRRTRASVTSIVPILDRRASQNSAFSSSLTPDSDRRPMIPAR